MSTDLHKYRYIRRRLPPPSTRRIVVLTGARQTGKTTLCKAAYPSLRYLNLDAPENRDTLRQLSTLAWAGTVGQAVIDEAQKEPVIFEKVKYAFDAGEIAFTVITGSCQILLLKQIRESLAGRAFFYEMWPLMASELNLDVKEGMDEPALPLLDAFFSGQPVSKVLSPMPPVLLESNELPMRQAQQYLLAWGGMPALLPLGDEERWEWLKNYGYTYLERDLTDLARLEDLMPFRKYQQLSALRSGMLLNYSDLARDVGVSADTARRYMEYLKLSYQTVLLQPYYKNLTSTAVKTPKLFWMDIGIWRQLTGFRGDISGQLYETMVVSEIVKWMRTQGKQGELYFYRTRSGMEVDLLLETPDGIIGMEIKSRSTVDPKDARPMQALARQFGDQWIGGLVIYGGKNIDVIAEPDIWAVPSHRLLQPAA
ncbi:MAG: ATP-binding protein [Desulfobacteraceae bacterium]|nr:ATP-binding protein [Desulfobacteraceae bacterium]